MANTWNLPDLPNLPNAQQGAVVTRFPPEAAGYLHLGHIKALLINYSYAKKYNGKFILRFDDTNPDKEKTIYEQAIRDDIDLLGLTADEITFASAHFELMERLAKNLIEENLAYVDFSTKEEIKFSRANLSASPYRNSTVADNTTAFEKMQMGIYLNCCLRAKIDFKSANGSMRDPVIYRAKSAIHPRQGSKYHIYPTYDFSCPILDIVEKVTHAMRSVEYSDRKKQYEWFINALKLRNEADPYPILSDYGKLNFSHTVLSKKKLVGLIGNSQTDDPTQISTWCDPRMPTIRGIMRSGIQIQPLMDYIRTQINSRAVVTLAWDKLWNFNKIHLDKTVCRIYGLNADPIKIGLHNTQGDLPKSIQILNHPKNSSYGTRTMPITSNLLVDKSDFDTVKIDDRYTLIGLGNAAVVNLSPITLMYYPADRNFKNTTKITWLNDDEFVMRATVRTFGLLLSKPKLEATDNIADFVNKNSFSEKTYLLENSIRNFPKESVVQIMRKEYCYIDAIDETEIILHTVPLSNVQ